MAASFQKYLYEKHCVFAVDRLNSEGSIRLLDAFVKGRRGSSPKFYNIGSIFMLGSKESQETADRLREGLKRFESNTECDEYDEELFRLDREQLDIKHTIESRAAVKSSLRIFGIAANLDIDVDTPLELQLQGVQIASVDRAALEEIISEQQWKPDVPKLRNYMYWSKPRRRVFNFGESTQDLWVIYEILHAKKVSLKSVDSHSGAVGADITPVVPVGGPPVGANLRMSATKETLLDYTLPYNKVMSFGFRAIHVRYNSRGKFVSFSHVGKGSAIPNWASAANLQTIPMAPQTIPMAPASLAPTNQKANSDLLEAAKAHDELKAVAAIDLQTLPMAPASLAATNQKANSDLLEAANAGNESEVVAALAQPGVDVNCCEEEGFRRTPLLLACNAKDEKKNVGVVGLLLKDPRVNVNARDRQGQTVLHSFPNDDVLNEILLSKRTDIDWNAADMIDQTPLLWSARVGTDESFRQLIGVESVNLFSKTIDLFTALHQVAERGTPFPTSGTAGDISQRCNIVDLVLEAVGRTGPNVVSFVDATDILNRSALHYIAEEGCIEIFELLCKLSPNMNVNGVDFHGFTPLHLAVRNGHNVVVERLLKLQSIDANVRATVNASNPDKLKRFENPEDLVELYRPDLFSKKPKEQPSHYLTPLHFAAMDGHMEVVTLLLEREGIDIDAEDSAGLTPLHYSVQNGHSEVVELLLKKGKSFATLDYDRQCGVFKDLLCLATKREEKTIAKTIAIQLLNTLGSRMNAFADISTKFSGTQSFSDQSRLLASAAVSNHFEIIKYIVKWQPEVNVNEKSKWAAIPDLVATPLHFAAVAGGVATVGGPGCGHVEAVQKLLEHPKLDVNAEDNRKWTPLLYAIEARNVDMVKVLCKKDQFHRLRANEENPDGKTPLQIVVEHNNLREDPDMKAIEKVLLERPEVKDFVDRLYRDRQVFVDAANALLVGAALIASVTFAGWLQPPLGYTPYYDFSQPFPAPPGAYESYAAIKQNPKVKAFWVFNSLSFFFAIATVLAGADAAMPSLDDAFIGRVVKSVRRSLITASILLVMSVVCVLGAFASGGFAVLPPDLKYDTSMIITVCVGGTVCMIILAKFLWKLAKAIRIRVRKIEM